MIKALFIAVIGMSGIAFGAAPKVQPRCYLMTTSGKLELAKGVAVTADSCKRDCAKKVNLKDIDAQCSFVGVSGDKEAAPIDLDKTIYSCDVKQDVLPLTTKANDQAVAAGTFVEVDVTSKFPATKKKVAFGPNLASAKDQDGETLESYATQCKNYCLTKALKGDDKDRPLKRTCDFTIVHTQNQQGIKSQAATPLVQNILLTASTKKGLANISTLQDFETAKAEVKPMSDCKNPPLTGNTVNARFGAPGTDCAPAYRGVDTTYVCNLGSFKTWNNLVVDKMITEPDLKTAAYKSACRAKCTESVQNLAFAKDIFKAVNVDTLKSAEIKCILKGEAQSTPDEVANFELGITKVDKH